MQRASTSDTSIRIMRGTETKNSNGGRPVAENKPSSTLESADVDDLLKIANALAGDQGSAPPAPAAENGEHKSDITSVLEAANDYRKIDNILGTAAGDREGGISGIISGAPTLEDLADALSEGEDGFFDAETGADDDDDDDDDDVNKPAYTAETVAAITSLMKGEESSLFANSEGASATSNGGRKKEKSALAKREISLQDRATAMISVYKDFLEEEEEEVEGIINKIQMQQRNLDAAETLSTSSPRDLRREEIKIATLEKFCKGVPDDDDDDESDDSWDFSGGRFNPVNPPPKPHLQAPTAATTTAAFRLKTEVALQAAKKAAGAVKTKVKGGKTALSEDVRQQVRDVENDYDYQDYNKKMSNEYHDIIEDEVQDDMEYGISSSMKKGGGVNSSHQMQNGGNDIDIYGMHIIDRDNSLKRKTPQVGDDVEAIGIFNELCDELGVTPDTHTGLRSVYKHPRGGLPYKYPIFRTKKFRRSLMYAAALILFLLICVSVLSAITNGFEAAREKKAPPLPDWKAEENWREKQKEQWEKEHANDIKDSGANADHGPKGESTGQQNMGKLFQSVSAAYRPVWYDRSTGWTGQTYAEALAWCDDHDNYIPCPYEVYCPNEKTLLAGVMDFDGESWAPVINAMNEWVQVGTGEACDLYSTAYGNHPDWGENGQGNEAITRHIMCCRLHPTQGSTWDDVKDGEHVARPSAPRPSPAGGSEQSQEGVDLDIMFLSMSKKYGPAWFDRNSGWKGQTYQESLDFCAQLDDYTPCPYEVYCPGGFGKLFDGIQDQGESWSAVSDGENDWVQVGAGGECNLYSETAKELPSWGMTGENNEEITRHIMCCKRAGDADATADNTAAPPDATDMTGPPLVTLPEPSSSSMTELEIKIEEAHHPTWYNNELGWKGTTYNDAKAFCESIPHGDSGTLHLCPLEAYCPNGPRVSAPLYLQMDAFEGVQWAPMSNEDNGWIMVGRFSDEQPMTCKSHLDINHHEPDWGQDGTSPELKRNILCCEDDTGSDGGIMKGDEENAPSGEFMAENYNSGNDEHGAASQPDDIGSSSTQDATSNTATTSNEEQPSSVLTELETQIQDEYHPTWFNKDMGWAGTTHDDAKAFCATFSHGDGKTLHLCPVEAYCPDGPKDRGPLYLHKDAYEGVQWAPISNEDNGWIMVGDIAGLTCQTYMQINHREPIWGLDGSSTQLKEQILCCEGKTNNNIATQVDVQAQYTATDGGNEGKVDDMHSGPDSSNDDSSIAQSIKDSFSPMWFGADRGGWNGGSHDDAIQFCEQFAGSHGKRMELCPYAAYCPEGPTKPVLGGHMADFDKEGEQWAPVFGKSNHWVLIGKREQNSSTTCLSHEQLTGEEPAWGLNGSNTEMKKHVMCCSPFQ